MTLRKLIKHNSKTMKPHKNLLIACTGSVATIKLPSLINLLFHSSIPIEFSIKIILTEHSKHFLESKDIPVDVEILEDKMEWLSWNKRGDPVLHIDLGKWADAMIIAPLDANSLAKISSGICDNLLLCTVRAWDFDKPLLFCPAMNTRMYDHPITKEQIEKLKSWRYKEIPCISKKLMCGDTGNGAMADIETIVREICSSFKIYTTS